MYVQMRKLLFTCLMVLLNVQSVFAVINVTLTGTTIRHVCKNEDIYFKWTYDDTHSDKDFINTVQWSKDPSGYLIMQYETATNDLSITPRPNNYTGRVERTTEAGSNDIGMRLKHAGGMASVDDDGKYYVSLIVDKPGGDENDYFVPYRDPQGVQVYVCDGVDDTFPLPLLNLNYNDTTHVISCSGPTDLGDTTFAIFDPNMKIVVYSTTDTILSKDITANRPGGKYTCKTYCTRLGYDDTPQGTCLPTDATIIIPVCPRLHIPRNGEVVCTESLEEKNCTVKCNTGTEYKGDVHVYRCNFKTGMLTPPGIPEDCIPVVEFTTEDRITGTSQLIDTTEKLTNGDALLSTVYIDVPGSDTQIIGVSAGLVVALLAVICLTAATMILHRKRQSEAHRNDAINSSIDLRNTRLNTNDNTAINTNGIGYAHSSHTYDYPVETPIQNDVDGDNDGYLHPLDNAVIVNTAIDANGIGYAHGINTYDYPVQTPIENAVDGDNDGYLQPLDNAVIVNSQYSEINLRDIRRESNNFGNDGYLQPYDNAVPVNLPYSEINVRDIRRENNEYDTLENETINEEYEDMNPSGNHHEEPE